MRTVYKYRCGNDERGSPHADVANKPEQDKTSADETICVSNTGYWLVSSTEELYTTTLLLTVSLYVDVFTTYSYYHENSFFTSLTYIKLGGV